MNAKIVDVVEPRPARVEIIPLIDVIFFLLATFVLFTLSLERLRSLEAVLPDGHPFGRPEAEMIFIQAAAGETFFWKVGSEGLAEIIAVPEIGPRLAEFRRRVREPKVMIQSDGRARLGSVVAVLDEVRRAGVKQVAVETAAVRAGR